MLTFMHMTCEVQLWDIFAVVDFYTSNHIFKMAKIGSYKYFLVLFAFAQCENSSTNPQNGYWFQTKRRPSKWFKYWIKCKNNLLKDYANWTQERHERLCIHKRLCAYLPVKFLNPNKNYLA